MVLRRIVTVIVAAVMLAGGVGACGQNDVDRGVDKATDKASQAGKKAEKAAKKAGKDIDDELGD